MLQDAVDLDVDVNTYVERLNTGQAAPRLQEKAEVWRAHGGHGSARPGDRVDEAEEELTVAGMVDGEVSGLQRHTGANGTSDVSGGHTRPVAGHADDERKPKGVLGHLDAPGRDM